MFARHWSGEKILSQHIKVYEPVGFTFDSANDEASVCLCVQEQQTWTRFNLVKCAPFQMICYGTIMTGWKCRVAEWTFQTFKVEHIEKKIIQLNDTQKSIQWIADFELQEIRDFFRPSGFITSSILDNGEQTMCSEFLVLALCTFSSYQFLRIRTTNIHSVHLEIVRFVHISMICTSTA